MRARIGLLAQPEPMTLNNWRHSARAAARFELEIEFGSKDGVHLALHSQPDPTRSLCSAFSEQEPAQQANSRLTACHPPCLKLDPAFTL